MSAQLSTAEAAHEAAVKEMFSGIAGRYDLLNHVLSLNIDKSWRRKVRNELAPILAREDAVVLDVACGTGDLSMELSRDARSTVVGTDFCRPMLAVARAKDSTIPYIEADAMGLPFPGGAFDAVTIAFGLRNLPNFERGLQELNRVLKPGGTLAAQCGGVRNIQRLHDRCAALAIDPPIWQTGYFDRYLRSSESYSEKWHYVEQNAVRARLVKTVKAWPYRGTIHHLMF